MAARSHSLVFVVVISDTAEGQFPPIYQDRFGTHFRGKICWKAFSRKKVPKSGDRHGTRNSPTTASLRSHLPKAFPLGGRCPSAHTGADEGAILYPTFPCRKEGGSRLSPQRNFSSAPLGNPVAPSSVTSGDSFPPRGSLRRWYTPATKCFRTQLPLPQNANPNQGTSMGFVIAHRPEHCAPPRQNERVATSGP